MKILASLIAHHQTGLVIQSSPDLCGTERPNPTANASLLKLWQSGNQSYSQTIATSVFLNSTEVKVLRFKTPVTIIADDTDIITSDMSIGTDDVLIIRQTLGNATLSCMSISMLTNGDAEKKVAPFVKQNGSRIEEKDIPYFRGNQLPKPGTVPNVLLKALEGLRERGKGTAHDGERRA